MANTFERIKEAYFRNRKALELRPGVGRGTAVAHARMVDGCLCVIQDGPWKLVADMSEKHGGTNEGPNPGVLVRAALASCLSIGYVRYAAVAGIPISGLEIEVLADYDSRGEFGVSDSPPGYHHIRIFVSVESSAPEEEIREMIDQADAHSPVLALFTNDLHVNREVQVKTPVS